MLPKFKLPEAKVQFALTSTSAMLASSATLQVRTLAEETDQPEPVTVTSTSPASATLDGFREMDGPSCAEAALAPTQVTSAKAIPMNNNLVLVMT